MRKRLSVPGLKLIGSLVLGYLLHKFPARFIEDSLMGWLQNWLAERQEFLYPLTEQILTIFIAWIAPMIGAIAVVWLVFYLGTKQQNSKPSLVPIIGSIESGPVEPADAGVINRPIDIEIRSSTVHTIRGSSMVGVLIEATFRPQGVVQLAQCDLITLANPISPALQSPFDDVPTFTLPRYFASGPETHRILYEVPAGLWSIVQGPDNYHGHLRLLASGEEYDTDDFPIVSN